MISLSSILKEVFVKPKEVVGVGLDHSVYVSKKNPDRLYKIGSRRIVEQWLNVFKQFPQYFPKVYRAGKITGLEEDQEFYFVEIERLNTAQVSQEWNVMESTFRELGIIEHHETFDSILYTKITRSLKNTLNTQNKEIYTLFMKWLKFIEIVDVIVKKSGKHYLDTHRGNLGYDSSGNIKCLDI